METHRRRSDGRRIFTPAFKQEQLARVGRQEVTLAELARELAVAPSVVRRWHQLSTRGSTAAVRADEDVVPASELRAAQQRIKELLPQPDDLPPAPAREGAGAAMRPTGPILQPRGPPPSGAGATSGARCSR